MIAWSCKRDIACTFINPAPDPSHKPNGLCLIERNKVEIKSTFLEVYEKEL